MDYRKCAQEIYETAGKRDNLVSAAHCATRLRLVTKDNSKVDMKHLEDIDGLKGVFASNGQLQIILGTGVVNKVYDEFLSVSGMTAATKDEVKAAAAAAGCQGPGRRVCTHSARHCSGGLDDGPGGGAGAILPRLCAE